MGYGCMYILRNVKESAELKRKLICAGKENRFDLGFKPVHNLLLQNTISIGADDYAFELKDDLSPTGALVLLSTGMYPINGILPERSLPQRLRLLQIIAAVCAAHTEKLEMFLGEDSGYLPDFTFCRMPRSGMVDYLLNAYQDEMDSVSIPCVHMVIEDA